MPALQSDRELAAPRDADDEPRPPYCRQVFGDVIEEAAEAGSVAAVSRIMTAAAAFGHRDAIARGREFVTGAFIPTGMALDPVKNHEFGGVGPRRVIPRIAARTVEESLTQPF